MVLSTVVRGDPASCHSTGVWLAGRYGGAVSGCADSIHQARRASADCWSGGASDAFRARMHSGATQADDLASDAKRDGQALQRYGDSLTAAEAKMDQARQVAIAGGLPVDAAGIGDPGPAPLMPTAAPAPATPQQEHAQAQALQVLAAHEAMVHAYREAGEFVADAGEILHRAQDELLRLLADQLEKAPLTAFDALAGMVTGYGAWAAKRARLLQDAGIAGRLASNPTFSYQGVWKALLIQRDKLGAAEKALRRSNTPLARATNRIPAPIREGLAWSADELVPERATGVLARGSRAVLSKVPGVGGFVTAAGVGADVAAGKPVGKAVFSGAAGFAGGAAAAAIVASGPVGLSVAAGVGIGIAAGIAAEWAWDNGVGDFAHDAWEQAGDVLDDGETPSVISSRGR